jgi:nitrite reductase/ring-hydroxylating ferredoxin subunit
MQEDNGGDAFVRIFSVAELKPGAKRVKMVGPYEVGVFNIDGTIYAIDDVCPHVDGPLHSGPVDAANKTVTCPLHAWCFSLVDGASRDGRRASIATFEVSIRGDDVYVSAHPRIDSGTAGG